MPKNVTSKYFSHSDKFFRYEMSGNFERKKGKASKDFPLHSPLSSTDTRSVFVVCFHQASLVTAQVDRQQMNHELICRGF